MITYDRVMTKLHPIRCLFLKKLWTCFSLSLCTWCRHSTSMPPLPFAIISSKIAQLYIITYLIWIYQLSSFTISLARLNVAAKEPRSAGVKLNFFTFFSSWYDSKYSLQNGPAPVEITASRHLSPCSIKLANKAKTRCISSSWPHSNSVRIMFPKFGHATRAFANSGSGTAIAKDPTAALAQAKFASAPKDMETH